MDSSRSLGSVAANSSSLGFSDRQVVLKRIVEELQELCDGAPVGVFDGYPVLARLLEALSASAAVVAKADDLSWNDIIGELLKLRGTMMRLAIGAGRSSH
ncbi:hypothetical protein [Rhizobium lentis]|uniref:Uncharacterized protein n=1 Tax=Rhizobium lentis TaxID=1138194 RepID=A0A7W8UP42_9HYPH|nr:hypothetical protein [Rhizobium lentis]MBB5551034.1 hypothetical protein [Rhizobium lentis]MBB5561569.1 hypothetical protein [Rhizobium lentis]MBB5568153.1 hypothetical protein [Rhizobium lentis]